MDTPSTQNTPQEEAVPWKTGRPPPISAVNPIQLQMQPKGVVSGNFEFRNTRNRNRVVTRGMAEFLSVKSYFDSQNLSYFSFFPKSEKLIKAVIRHLPHDTPAKDISDDLVSLGFDVVGIEQMTAALRSPPEEPKVINLPIFLVTLPKTAKSQEVSVLPRLCHIPIRLEADRAQNSLTQCHNSQEFDHVWANCKQPPHCLWCGDGYLQKECPEKGNTSSTPTCCICRLAEREKPHPANYRGCRHAKEELQRKKSHKTTT
jgi:hypothetical protein